MLDIKFIKENKDIVKAGAEKKHITVDIDRLLDLDEKRLEVLVKVESFRSEQNKMSKLISIERDENARTQMIQEMQTVKEDLKESEELLKTIMTEWKELMLHVPNVPDISVPDGDSEDDNKELRTWGEKPNFDFEAKDHIELMTNLNMVDFERGTKVHGFRGYFLQNDGALLSWAIWNYARDFFLNKNFNQIIAPTIVNKEYFYDQKYKSKN